MTQQEIIEMARQAGFIVGEPWREILIERFAKLVAQHERERLTDAAMKAAEKAVDVAIALEREACAKVCDDLWKDNYTAYACAEAIRARGQA